MKQSTKLLSLVLALVMAFSCMTVIGNAALVKSEVAWDNIDDANLSAEQVADLALDLVDNDLLAGMEAIDLSILGQLRLDSIDHICADISDLTGGIVWGIGKGLLGDLGDMDFSPIKNKSRSQGDLQMIKNVVKLVGNDNNSAILSKIAYGIGTSNGISLGLVGNFLDLGDIGDLLGDIPKLVRTLVYDLLIYGSYGYDKNAEELDNNIPFSNLDVMVNTAVNNLLINPQDYDYDPDTDEKVWDMKSVILPGYAADPDRHVLDLTQDSVFGALDILAQYAIDDIGINALNNNLKKALMEAVEADFVEIDKAALPAAVAADFEVDVDEAEKSYVTYIAYDRMCKDGTNWYYTTVEREDMIGENGDPVVDKDGNVQTERVRKYFKVNMAAANEFASLINWDWYFVGSEGGDGVELSYDDILSIDGTIAGGINHLISIVFENALVDSVKEDFETVTGDTWIDGGNENLTDNVTRVVKYLLANFGDRIFGSDSAYAEIPYEELEPMSVVDIVAMIGPGFFQDAMPQIIIPKNADGTYAFHQDVQILEFGALVIREFATDIAPNVNYDSFIFEAGNVKSANDRLFREYDVEGWFNIILNMGLDIGYTYLNQITNFNTAIPAAGITEDRWQDMLDDAIMWAVNYVSDGTNSVLMGMDPATVGAIEGPLSKLSYILNTILPLGFINGCVGDYAVDLNVVLQHLKDFFATFDLSIITGFFGRSAEYNILAEPVIPMVLSLVNRILNLVFNNTTVITHSNTLESVINQANLKSTVQKLLRALNGRASSTGLLESALPVVGKLIKGWGTEQNFNTPQISLSRSIDLTNGATTEAQTVNIRNASDGVWRHYRDAVGNEYTDEQYKIVIKSVVANDEMGESGTSQYVTIGSGFTTTAIDYGQSGSFTYTAANVPTSGALVRFDIGYQVLGEDGAAMANGKIFYAKCYAWLNYNPTNAGTAITNDSELIHTAIYTPQYVGLKAATEDNGAAIKALSTSYFGRDYKFCTKSQTGKVTNNSGTVDGLTFASLSQEFANNDKGRYARDVRNFDSYVHNLVNKDGESTSDNYTVSGSVNVAAFKAANKTSGSRSDFSITLTDKEGSENTTFSLIYYDDVYFNKLGTLAANEMDAVRLAADYNLEGTFYTNDLLTTANTTDDEGEIVFRDTNFTAYAWISPDDTGYYAAGEAPTTYADSAVTVTDKNEDDVAIAGKVTVDGKEIAVKKVTVIDCGTAINNYVAAFVPGIRGGMQCWNANSVYNFQALYEAFYVSSNDVGYCKKSTEQIVAEGNGDNIDAAVATLKSTLNTVEATYTDSYDFTDYKMYRLNRLNDAREDAAYYVNLQNDASNATVAEIDETFPYTSINEDDLKALVKGDKYEANILALLEKMDEEEIKSTAKWLEDKKLEYQSATLLDVEMAQSYLELTSQRLLNRDHGVLTNFLADEIASAEAMVGDESEYTARSWAKYSAALQTAKDVLNAANGKVRSQMTVFDAKYELMCCRNELVLVDNEADYSELEALISQATFALENQNLYNNTAKDFGRVLAELGYHSFTNADGDSIDLFPGSAIYVNTEPYGKDQQAEIDQAAYELKVELAKLKFINVQVSGAGVADETLVEGDEEAGIEAVVAKVARIGALLDADAVKDLFSATADGANVTKDLINVSDDTVYTVDTDLAGFAGTDATVTFYTLVNVDGNDVKIPVATVKIVVEGDINGDGVINVLDASIAELASNSHAELEGCFFLAANLAAASAGIAGDDFSAVLNKALAA